MFSNICCGLSQHTSWGLCWVTMVGYVDFIRLLCEAKVTSILYKHALTLYIKVWYLEGEQKFSRGSPWPVRFETMRINHPPSSISIPPNPSLLGIACSRAHILMQETQNILIKKTSAHIYSHFGLCCVAAVTVAAFYYVKKPHLKGEAPTSLFQSRWERCSGARQKIIKQLRLRLFMQHSETENV